VGRSKGSANLTYFERERIRQLYRSGVRIADIVKQVGRSVSVVQRNTRDLARKKPPPPKGKHATRNDRILKLAAKGMSRAAIGRLLGLSPTQVGYAIINHPHLAWLLQVKRLKPATVASRYRLELSTALRILRRKKRGEVKRTREGFWG